MKTMKIYLSIAALALMGAVMTGCSSDDDSVINNSQQLENTSKKIVTLTTTVGLDTGATTRSLTAAGVKTFAEGEQMAVVYNNGTSVVKAVSRALEAGDITNEGKTASFTFDLETPNTSVDVTYIYPAAMAKADGSVNYDALANQDGTLASLSSNLDLATKTAAWDGTSLPSCTLQNQLVILAVTLKDIDGSNNITGDITGLTLNDGTNSYTVTRSAAAGPIYVAIQPTDNAKIWISATDGTKNYIKTLTKTYAANNGYNVSWKMATIGDAILYDGTFAKKGTSGFRALITYIGNDAETSTTYNHGLALATYDANNLSKAKWCSKSNATCLTTQYGENNLTDDIAGIANTDYLIDHAPDGHTHAAASAARNFNETCPTNTSGWFLPSAGQWMKMITAAGGFANLRTNAGLQSDGYWSSTEFTYNYAWYFYFKDQGTRTHYYKTNEAYIRSAVAF